MPCARVLRVVPAAMIAAAGKKRKSRVFFVDRCVTQLYIVPTTTGRTERRRRKNAKAHHPGPDEGGPPGRGRRAGQARQRDVPGLRGPARERPTHPLHEGRGSPDLGAEGGGEVQPPQSPADHLGAEVTGGGGGCPTARRDTKKQSKTEIPCFFSLTDARPGYTLSLSTRDDPREGENDQGW